MSAPEPNERSGVLDLHSKVVYRMRLRDYPRLLRERLRLWWFNAGQLRCAHEDQRRVLDPSRRICIACGTTLVEGPDPLRSPR